jgi:hypothetical protein
MVNKDVSALFLLDETESFLVTEPLYNSFCQNAYLL